MSLQTAIEALLDELALFSGEETQKLREECAQASEAQRVAVLATLREAKDQQDEWMKAIVAHDPAFPKKLEAFFRTLIGSLRSQTEQEDSAAIKDIENQFQS